eukprot:scaffold16458_cov62-Cylindrotheca_fusiformis.AAC.1
MTQAADSSSRKNEIGRVVRKFERKEILSLLELCLWKVKIDKVTSEQVLLVDRQECRIMSGAAVVSKDSHPKNERSPICSSPTFRLSTCKLVHIRNAPFPITVTVDGKSTVLKDAH